MYQTGVTNVLKHRNKKLVLTVKPFTLKCKNMMDDNFKYLTDGNKKLAKDISIDVFMVLN